MTVEQPPSEAAIAKSSDSLQISTEATFPVVGIAASAGGLAAFRQLLSHLPADTGMGFVLVQHLDPHYKSMLSEILGRETQMPVCQVEDGMVVEPNHVYVIPPNTQMKLAKGTLHLTAREKVLGTYLPGDALFKSLAIELEHKAIAVVLSGGDGDGSLGLKAIKAAGGITFAQCEETAQFDSMPNKAVATGAVDFVLPPQKIAEELGKLSQHPLISKPVPLVSAPEISPSGVDALSTIFALLKSASGVDFALYKPTTLDRRIQRRMLLYKLEQLDDYARYLQENPAEVNALYEEILIHVTGFFRDTEAFDLLKEQVFPIITQNKSAESPVRIWVAGCSTGEEVYSIAICLLEFLRQDLRKSTEICPPTPNSEGARDQSPLELGNLGGECVSPIRDRASAPPIQFFATDISQAAINKARSGIYPAPQMADVSLERRNAFFIVLEDGSYQICKAIRELCVFARQDLSSDPPFSNLDLISCRNVLIYMGETLQKRLMPIFHYSLKPTGFLMLGTSEGIGTFSDLFELTSRKYKIHTKKLANSQSIFSFATSSYPIAKVDQPKPMTQNPLDSFDLQKETDQLIVDYYAPVGVVVNDKLEILQIRGDTSPYLQLAPGKASLNLFRTVRETLLKELHAAFYQAQQQNVSVKKERVRLKTDDPLSAINLMVMPFKLTAIAELYFLVLFEAAPPAINSAINSAIALDTAPENLEQEVLQLRQALAAMTQEQRMTQENLQAMMQGQENIHQDLKVANEEILSSNEELQSTNEELETAKEEIQATNEELNTINEELRSSNLELHQVNNDLTNLLASINVPILMLASDFRIRRFTPQAQRLFNFIAADAGRPLSDIRTNLNLPDLEGLIAEVLETLIVKELEVQTQAGHWYNLLIRPYRTTENRIDGVVLVLMDIDGLKRGAVALEESRNYAEAIVETVPLPLIVLDAELRVNSANQSFYQTFQVAPPETQKTLLFDLGNGQWNLPDLRSRLENVFVNNTLLQNFQITHSFDQIGQKTMLLNACKILHLDDTEMLLLAIEDITERQQFEVERSQLLSQEQLARQEAETANHAKDEFLSNLSHELRNPLNIMLGWTQLLRTHKLEEATVTRALEVIERSARAQTQMIEELLDISRITSGKLHLATYPIDLVPIITRAIESAQLAADAKTIQLVSQLTSATLIGDSNRLQQVLWNLLTNAIKFTPAGGRVEVTLEPMPTHAEIRVHDTGQGIRADVLPYVFDRFRQGDSTTTKSSQGLGLGLSIVRHIVESHGGTVRAESPGVDQGTTMIVRLPLAAALPEMPKMLAATAASELEPSASATDVATDVATDGVTDEPTPKAPSLAGLQILAVDDEADSRELIQWMLSDLGATVVVAASAREAIAALTDTSNQFDLLLSDIGMPEVDGLSLIRQVRAMDSAVSQIPAAALTAYASDRELTLAIEAGFQVHIAKPIEPVQLATIIATLANRD